MLSLSWLRFESRTLRPSKVVAVMLAIAACLALIMALVSAFNDQADKWFGHPDEYLHRSAARYYTDHWLPPKIGETATLDSYSRDYGVSYLNERDVVYFLAGKFALLLDPLVRSEDLGFRLFNVFLLTLLAWFCARRDTTYLIFLPLLLSPQIWYIFSYFNGDAFPLFISILVAVQVAVPESAFNRYMDSSGIARGFSGALVFGVLIGLLLLSKRNFYAFLAMIPAIIAVARVGRAGALLIAMAILFAASVRLRWIELASETIAAVAVAWGVVTLGAILRKAETRRVRARALIKLGAVGFLAASLLLPQLLADLAMYGSFERKEAALGALAEQLAKPEYKPSRIYTASPESFYGTSLRTRGVKFSEIFMPPWNWPVQTFLSATGHYGWLQFRSATIYYVLLGAAYGFLFLYLARSALRSRDPDVQLKLLLVFVFSMLMIAVSAYYSWISDFQAQGRYLFPIIAMIGVGLESARRQLNPRVVHGVVAVCFALSLYSFVFTALWDIPKGH